MLKKIALQTVLAATLYSEKKILSLEKQDILTKEDGTFVTVADYALQCYLNFELLSHFPDIPIMAEEESSLLLKEENSSFKKRVLNEMKSFYSDFDEKRLIEYLGKGDFLGSKKGRYFVIDPIDGTRGFIHKEQYAIALALIEDGSTVFAILSCPKMGLKGTIFLAEKGKGAFLYNPSTQALEAYKMPSSDLENLIYSEPKKNVAMHHSHLRAEKIAKKLHVNAQSFRLDSQCKYALVASALATIYLRFPRPFSHVEKVWDHAAGALICQEAGGKVTDLYGRALDFSLGRTLKNNRGIIASNGLFHDKIVECAIEVAKEEE